MKSWPTRLTLALVAALLLPACSGTILVGHGPPDVTSNGLLRNEQVVPAVSTGAGGNASVTVAGSNDLITYTINPTALGSAATAVEIHLGAPGANGPVLFPLPLGTFPMTGALNTTSPFMPGGGVSTFAAACEQIKMGNTYLLIRTTGQPNGEVRAHLGTAQLNAAILSGGQEVPPVATAGTGSATVSLNPAQDELTVTVNHSGLVSVTGAQIFDGKAGAAGTTALFDVATAAFPTGLTVTLTSAEFTASAGAATFDDMVALLLTGGLHLQILTALNSSGELRGQIGPVQLNASLTGADVFPPNSSTAVGQGNFSLNASQTEFLVTLTHNVGMPTAVTMHADDPGSNGPQIFDVDAIAGSPASPVSVTLQSFHLIKQPSKGITDFPTFIDSLLRGKTYVDVGSTGFPAGEIRGQILP